MRTRLPIPAPPVRHAWIAWMAPLLSALAVLIPSGIGRFPGDPALPFGPVFLNLQWQVHTRGLSGYMADDLHGFPFRTDRLVTDGLPLDALTSWPLTAAFGFEAGMWVWLVAVVWAIGAAGAWLGMRWWGSVGAGLIVAVGLQLNEAALRELAEGRPSQLFSTMFLPVALGLGVEAARSGRVWPAAGAGVAAAFGIAASWGMAPLFGLAALGPGVVVAGADLWRRTGTLPRAAVPLATTLAALLVPLLPVAAWVYAGRGELPSFDMDPWTESVLGLAQTRPVDLAAARIFGTGGVALGTLTRPLLLAAAAWAVARRRFRHVAAPATFACLAAILGLGSWLPGPVVLPWGWLQALPGFGRLWWADRAWIGVGLGLALLAGGAPRRWLPWVAAGMVGEAWLLSAALPLPVLPAGRSPAAEVLARAPDVPLVLLPTAEGPFRPDRLDLLDQIGHGRPLANGTRPVLDLTSSDAVLRGWRNNTGLRALLSCEMGGGASVGDAERAGATAALVHAGLREVYLDPRYVEADPAYAACVEGVLAGWERGEEPPLVRFRAP